MIIRKAFCYLPTLQGHYPGFHTLFKNTSNSTKGRLVAQYFR